MAKKEDLKSPGTVDRIYKDVSDIAAMMPAEESKEPSKNEKYRESLIKQLKEFTEDDSILEKYEEDTIIGRYVLVRVFKFYGKEVSNSRIILPGGKVPGMGRSPVKVEDTIYDNKVLPIGKVIKVGNAVDDKDIVPGAIVQLPTEEVEGMAMNPDFIMYLEMKDAQGANPNFDPKDIPREIPKIQKEWLRYQYKHWLNIEPDDEDTLTYLLPENKILATKYTANVTR